jgi:hypothetical protein
VRLSFAAAIRVHRLMLAVPNASGDPFLSPADTVRLAVEIAAQVAVAGEMDRFRAAPRHAIPVPEMTEATRAWLEKAATEARAKADATAKAAKRAGLSAGPQRRR